MCIKSNILLVNFLTLFRLVASCFFIFKSDYNYIDLVFLFAILSTDFFDGYLARKLNSVTVFGREFDQITDKLVFYMLYGKLIEQNIGQASFLIVFILRDITISYLRYKTNYNTILKTGIINKLKTTLQFILILLGYSLITYKYNFEFLIQLVTLCTITISLFPIIKIILYEYKKMDR
jgi:CDP-diacylglycerol--glycerol-3-phosphate 3-phosphatidyltransferase